MTVAFAWLAIALALAATCIGQLCLRRTALADRRWLPLISGVSAWVAAVGFNFAAARIVGIGPVTVASALAYALVPWAASCWLHEDFPLRQRRAAWLIVAGVALYAF